MGRAVVLSIVGEGLHTIRPLYDTRAMDAEIADLQAQSARYAALLLEAQKTYVLLAADARAAKEMLDALLEQWKNDLIRAGDEVPPELPPVPPDDPLTGLPWEDPDRAQDDPLFAAINAARTAAGKTALARSAELDEAARLHLQWQRDTGSSGHIGRARSTAPDRATWAGYAWDEVLELLAYGQATPDAAVQVWTKNPESAILLADDLIDCGVGYAFGRTHIGGYLWGAMLGIPGANAPDPFLVPANDPAKEKAAKVGELDRVEPPKSQVGVPDKIAAASRECSLAVGKVHAAEQAVARLKVEQQERTARLAELQAAKTALQGASIHAWTADYTDGIPPGTEVSTAEIPGYYDPENTTTQTVTLFEGESNERQVSYTERPINILPIPARYQTTAGKLTPAIAMTPASVFVNAAMEPGHLNWKPAWRYGRITALAGNTCAVTVSAAASRLVGDESAMDLNAGCGTTLTNVPIYYPPCHGNAFEIGDDVLIAFTGQDRTVPRVVGFRRQPFNCRSRDWMEL